MVVDDEAAVRDALRRALRLEGYEVELAADGAEALRRLEDGAQPDALLLDVLMPGVDGLEVCRRLRRSGSRLPVLMLTARAEVSDRVSGLDAGVRWRLHRSPHPRRFHLWRADGRLSSFPYAAARPSTRSTSPNARIPVRFFASSFPSGLKARPPTSAE